MSAKKSFREIPNVSKIDLTDQPSSKQADWGAKTLNLSRPPDFDFLATQNSSAFSTEIADWARKYLLLHPSWPFNAF